MATHSDGSIIVDAEIDAEGFKADSQKLHKAIGSLNNKVKGLGPTFQKAISGNAKAISSFDMKADTLEGTIAEIQNGMSRLGSTKVSTEEYDELCESVNKAEQALFKLYDRRDKMEAIGTSKDSKAWKALQYDIENAERELASYVRGKKKMEAEGTNFTTGKSTVEFAELSKALADAKAQLGGMRENVQGAKEQLVEMGYYADVVKCVMAYYNTLSPLDAYRDLSSEQQVIIYLDDYYSSVLYNYQMRATV